MSQKSRVRSPHGARVLDWGCSSNGRASALHAEGTGIDTLLLHIFCFSHNQGIKKRMHVMKSQTITDGGVAQMVERTLSMREAQGSIPCYSIFFFHFFVSQLNYTKTPQ